MATPTAKVLRRAVGATLLLLTMGLVSFPGEAHKPASLARQPDTPLYCIHVWPEARYRNYGYDHYVHVYNGCAAHATCDVSTDVAPKPIKVRVHVGQVASVLTFRGSPVQQFVPRVSCVLDAGTDQR